MQNTRPILPCCNLRATRNFKQKDQKRNSGGDLDRIYRVTWMAAGHIQNSREGNQGGKRTERRSIEIRVRSGKTDC